MNCRLNQLDPRFALKRRPALVKGGQPLVLSNGKLESTAIAELPVGIKPDRPGAGAQEGFPEGQVFLFVHPAAEKGAGVITMVLSRSVPRTASANSRADFTFASQMLA